VLPRATWRHGLNTLRCNCCMLLRACWPSNRHTEFQRPILYFDNLVTVQLITAQDNDNVLSVIRTVRIPAHSEAILPLRLPLIASFAFNTPALVQAWPGLKQRGLGVAPILVQPSNRQTLCRIINVRPTNQLLRRGTKLAYLSEIDVSDPFNRAALNGVQNQAPAHSSAIGEHPSVTTIAFSDKLDAVTATGLKLIQARQRLNPAQFAGPD
jgi:hypothetical protein